MKIENRYNLTQKQSFLDKKVLFNKDKVQLQIYINSLLQFAGRTTIKRMYIKKSVMTIC